MDTVDELVIDVALSSNGRKGYYAGRNIIQELKDIEDAEKGVAQQNEKLNKSQEKAARSGFKLGSALKTIGLYIGVKEIVRYADEWRNISNILSQVTKTEEERISLQERLYRIGRKTRTGIEQTADLYVSLGSVGLSEQQQLNATDILQKAFKSTGANRRTIESIRRMLRTGKLSSLLGINQRLAEIIASGMNMSLTELQQRIRKGGFTSMEVLTALSNKSKDIDKNFSKTKLTLSEAFSGIGESIKHLLGNLEDKTGIFSKTAKVIELLSENIGHIGLILTSVLLTKFVKGNEILDLFFLNISDGLGLLKSLKMAFIASGTTMAAFTRASWALVAPWVKLLAVFELLNQLLKMLKGEWNWYAEFIDRIQRGTWWLMNKVTGQNKPFRGDFSSDVNKVTPAKNVTNTYGGGVENITTNQNINVTINEAKDGEQSYVKLEQLIRKASAGSGMRGNRPKPAWMKD